MVLDVRFGPEMIGCEAATSWSHGASEDPVEVATRSSADLLQLHKAFDWCSTLRRATTVSGPVEPRYGRFTFNVF